MLSNIEKLNSLSEERRNLLEFSPEGRSLLLQQRFEPMEGFAENIKESFKEYIQDSSNTVEKGHRCLQWFMTKVFEATEEDAENGIIDGPNDLGIDAYLPVDFSEDRIRIIQSKYGESHSIAAIDNFKENVERFLKQDTKKMRPELAELLKHINEKKLKIELYYVTDQDIQYNGSGVKTISFNDAIQILWERKKKPAAGKESNLRVINKIQHEDCQVCIVSAREIAEFVEKNRDYVFESNIRHFMQFKTAVNKGIRQTLEGCPEKLFVYNNGITITVDDFKEQEKNTLKLFAPQIVNGAQTVNAIYDRAKRTNSLNGVVTVTIIKAVQEQLQRNITKYRNSQNAVRGKDYVSLEDFHTSINSQVESYGYFYEIQAGSWDFKKPGERHKFQGDENFNKYLPDNHKKVIPSKDAIQAFVAFFEQRPNEAYSSAAKFLPRGSKYGEIFNDELKDDYRFFLFPTLIREYSKKEFSYGPKNKSHKTKRYATLLFVAVYAKLLNEKILEVKGNYKNNIIKLESVFRNFETNHKVMSLTDSIVSNFLSDYLVNQEISKANSPHNFFSQNVYNEKMLDVLEQKMDSQEIEICKIKECIKNL